MMATATVRADVGKGRYGRMDKGTRVAARAARVEKGKGNGKGGEGKGKGKGGNGSKGGKGQGW